MPETSPPPPTGTTTMSGEAPSCSTISSAMVPWPAMVAGWSKVGTTVAPVLAAYATGGGEGVVEVLSGEVEVDEVAGQGPDARHLLARRALGQEHRTSHAEVAAAPGHSLGVVAGTGTHHADGQGARGEAGDEVVGAADLVGAHHLQVLTLHVDRGVVALREPLVELERGQDPEGSEALRGGTDVVDADLVTPHT